MKKAKFIQKLSGGLADKKQPSDFNSKDLQEGIKVELEHTDKPNIAKEIAMDHLTEDPEYYKKLKVMEKKDKIKKAFSDIIDLFKGGDGSGKEGHTTAPRLPFPGEEAHKLGDVPKPAQTHVPSGGWQPHFTDYKINPEHGQLNPEGTYKHLMRNLKFQGKDFNGHVTFDPKKQEIQPLTKLGQKHIEYAKQNPHMFIEREKWTPENKATSDKDKVN